MNRWTRSPKLLKLFVGQHVANGLGVAAGVMAVAVAASALFGFARGFPFTLGAIAASIGDFPAPLRDKARSMSAGFALALLATGLALAAARWLPLEIFDDRRRLLRRRTHHRLWPLGARHQHADPHRHGAGARLPADEPRRRSRGARQHGGRRRGLYRDLARHLPAPSPPATGA